MRYRTLSVTLHAVAIGSLWSGGVGTTTVTTTRRNGETVRAMCCRLQETFGGDYVQRPLLAGGTIEVVRFAGNGFTHYRVVALSRFASVQGLLSDYEPDGDADWPSVEV